MTIGIIIATVMVCFYLYESLAKKKSAMEEDRSIERSISEEAEDKNTENVALAESWKTKTLVKDVLMRIGCEPEEEDENFIQFNYQGENFIIQANEERAFIVISDIWWYHLSTYCDVEEFARLRKAINASNRDGAYTVFYTISRDSEEIGVHTKRNELLIPQIPDIEDYMKSILNGFFRVQRFVHTELERLKVAEEDAQEGHLQSAVQR